MIAPLFMLAGLAACSIPIVLHFMRPKPRQIIPFPSLKFLHPAVLKENPRHKILRWIVLALRCLAFFLIGWSFARPLLKQPESNEDQAIVFVVDTSYSMQAGERLEDLVAWAFDQVDEANAQASSGLLVMQPAPQWVVPFGARLTDTKVQLQQVEAGFGGSDYRAALRLAGEALRESPSENRRIVLLGDHQTLAWQTVDFSEPLPPGVELVVPEHPIQPDSHVAVTDLKVISSQGNTTAQVTLMPHAVTQPEYALGLYMDGEEVDVKVSRLLTGQPSRLTFDLPKDLEPHWLEARLDQDDLSADNAVYSILRPRSIDVQLSPQEGKVDYLGIATDIGTGGEEDPLRVVEWPILEWPKEHIVVIRGDHCFQEEEVVKLDRFLSGGGRGILFYSGTDLQRAWLKEQGISSKPIKKGTKGLRLQDWDLTHPALAPFLNSDLSPLLTLDFPYGQSFDAKQVWPIARWSDRSVALAEVSIQGGTLVLAGFEADEEGTLVRSSTFLPLVHGIALWLAGQREAPEVLEVGDVVSLPSSGTWEALAGPDEGKVIDVNTAHPLTVPGVFQFTSEEGAEVLYAVNVSTQESDLRTWPTPEDFEGLRNPELPEPKEVEELSQARPSAMSWWLLALMFFLLLPEVTLSNRTAR